ncbi:hypothetical protein IU429_02675 [Nocardia elegans]|uniref:ApeA N-terminal domain-containing protein n=1 Tax=Nocardia elegans TaxID=300029 RepID=A0ABW6TE89_9NOCA|nr:hypothetical protein [Nocardia elegans]MBF6446566.1 hypothetical protein [Nocardia elegans]
MIEQHPFLPDICGIPAFEDLDHPQMVAVAGKVFVGELSPQLSEWRERQLFLNLVRLSDRAIVDFCLAREALIDYIAHRYEGRISTHFSAISHMEAGITALARCVDFANALARSPVAPAIGKEELPRKAVQDSIRKLRNSIEHTDGALKRGTISSGMAMLHVLDNRVELEGIALGWSELDVAMRKIHALAKRLIELPGPTSSSK